jgi:hypothetical protein
MDKEQLSRAKFRRLGVLEIDPKKVVGNASSRDQLRLLIDAVNAADAIFWRQVSPENTPESLLERARDDEELKEMILFNHGPYDRLSDNLPLLPFAPRKPGLGFYPPDLAEAELAAYLKAHPKLRRQFESPYTVLRRSGDELRAVPFHQAYEDLVGVLCDRLLRAASLEEHPRFREYLIQRAADLQTDDYFLSDSSWVNLADNPIDLVVGPYEVYQDELLGLKAAYEAFLLKRDFEQTAKVQHFQRELPGLCASLQPQLARSLAVDAQRVRLSVADLAYCGGDANTAIPAIAFALPNDERIIEEIGSRQVILRNVLKAKFDLVGWRVMQRVLVSPPADKDRAFQNFFDFTLFHEIAHAVGPHRLIKDGEATTVNRCLRQHYSVLEETKADVLGACLMATTRASMQRDIFFHTYVGGFVRSVRFGLGDAHGRGNAIQFNYLQQAGAIQVHLESGRISISPEKLMDASAKLAADILGLQESGDFDAADRFVKVYGVIGPELQRLVNAAAELPIDIRIRFAQASLESSKSGQGCNQASFGHESQPELVSR